VLPPTQSGGGPGESPKIRRPKEKGKKKKKKTQPCPRGGVARGEGKVLLCPEGKGPVREKEIVRGKWPAGMAKEPKKEPDLVLWKREEKGSPRKGGISHVIRREFRRGRPGEKNQGAGQARGRG